MMHSSSVKRIHNISRRRLRSCGVVLRVALAWVMVLAQTLLLYANPVDGVVSAGDANISSAGNTLTVTQASDKAVIDWRGFDIAHGETTNFVQPNASSMTLNRVNSNSASFIDGNLTANGNLIVVNPNGVWFGSGARVDVNSLIATTAGISNDAFMNSAGKLVFDQPGNPNAGIVNDGLITAKEAGLVGLVAPNVVNNGIIVAKLGRVHLASGDTATVDLYGDGLMDVAVSDAVTSQLVENNGIIAAEGGTIAMTAAAGKDIVNSLVKVSGELHAPSIKQKNGKIIIAAEGSNAVKNNIAAHKGKKTGSSIVIVDGVINASGRKAGERGGSVQITGDNIALLDGTVIDASGSDGLSGTTFNKAVSAYRDGSAGGDIRIGGDYLGGGDTATAKNLYVDKGVLVLNDALNSGDAGRTIFWSDDTTSFYGNVYARALGGKPIDVNTWNATSGGNTGDGGFIETSGHGHLDAGGYVDLTASNGERGTYFLDPTDITIYGNFAPNYATVVQGDSTALSANLKLWLDASDTANVNLTYNALGTTASGTTGTNTITVSSNTGLTIGARIRLGGAGSVTAASTLGSDTYTITNIAGTTITLSSNLTTTYTTSSIFQGYVSQLTDKSGLANNATQATAANMPLWVSNGLNGLGVAQYNGSSSFMTAANSASLTVANGTPVSIITIANAFSTAAKQSIINKGNYGVAWNYGTGTVAGGGLFARHNQGDILSSLSVTANIGQLLSTFYTGTQDSFYLNGSAANTLTDNGWQEAANTSSFYIGAAYNGVALTYNEFFNGTIPETLIYNNNPSANARNLVEQYQSNKWGIALTPPGSGASEAAQATASVQKGDAVDGYSVFTTRYLERLSQSANISLQSSNNITLNLQGDTLALSSGRNLTLTAGNDITSASNGTITTAGAGNISLVSSHDISFANNLTLNALGTGTVSLKAANNIIETGGGSIITHGGNITINSDSDAASGGAILLNTGVSVTSNGGNITLGGGATPSSVAAVGNATYTTAVDLEGATVSASGGNISILGTGYNSTSNNSRGVYVFNSTVQTTGSGTITITGRGMGTGTQEKGVALRGTAPLISSANGDINITGYGSTTSAQCCNQGVTMYTGIIQTTGAGNIFITGTGGSGLSDTEGVDVSNVTALGTGNITITGIGGSGSILDTSGATGIILGGGGDGNITANGGNITLNGTGGTNSAGSSYGVQLFNGNSIISNGTGTITFNGIGGTGGGNNIGVYTDLSSTIIGGASHTGNTIFNTDTISGSATVRTTGKVTFLTRTASTTIGVAGGAGTLGITSAMLDNISNASEVDIGALTDTGLLSANVYNWSRSAKLFGGSGGIAINGTQTMNGNTLFVQTANGGDVSIGASSGVSSSATGTAFTLVADRNFINNAGAGALSASSGRWLVYATTAANNTAGGLSSFVRYGCTYGGSCPVLPAGNGLLYSVVPNLTATASTINLVYGDDVPSVINYAYSISGYFGSDASADTISGSLNGSTNYTQGASVGDYALNYVNGSLASAMGYTISYANNARGISVSPKTLTVTANAASKSYASPDPLLSYKIAGFVNGDTASFISGAISRIVGNAVGVYQIIKNTLTVNNSNYSLLYVPALFSIMGNDIPATVTRVSQDPSLNMQGGNMKGNNETSSMTVSSFSTTTTQSSVQSSSSSDEKPDQDAQANTTAPEVVVVGKGWLRIGQDLLRQLNITHDTAQQMGLMVGN